MSSLIVKVVTFTLTPHSNADSLSLANPVGTSWQCCVKTENFEPGTLAVYIPIDSILPSKLASALGLPSVKEGKPYRIKTIKLRGEVSQGLLVPLDELIRLDFIPPTYRDEFKSYDEAGPNENIVLTRFLSDRDWAIGDDVADYLGITKYIEPEPEDRSQRSEPEGFIRYTDVENIKNFPDVLVEDEEVIATEKIHGCFHFRTKIRMADGSAKQINHVELGDFVLGRDAAGVVVPTRVTRIYNNGSSADWLSVKTTRNNAGRGKSGCHLRCTPNHQFWSVTRSQYIEARDLCVGEKVFSARTDGGLSPLQIQVLIGKILGDGNIHVSGGQSFLLNVCHKQEHLSYLDWTGRGLGDLWDVPVYEGFMSGYGSDMYRGRTRCSSAFREKFEDFLPTNYLESGSKKRIPAWVADEMGPIALAFWYMDDGSLGHHEGQEDRALLAACDWSEVDVDVLVRGLARNGVKGIKYLSDGWRIRINAEEAEKFFLLIAPYVPPVMQYKLPERYRGHEGWLPAHGSAFKQPLVEQCVLSVEVIPVGQMDSRICYDIETETHNYFAGDILVHNSNFRCGWLFFTYEDYQKNPNDYKVCDNFGIETIEGFIVGTRRTALKHRVEEGTSDNRWVRVVIRYGLEEKLKNYPGYIVFGEVFGVGVQKLTYAEDKVNLRLFDVWDGKRYLDYNEFVAFCAAIGVETAPVLYRGPYSASVLDLRSGKTVVGGGTHIREGIVIRPAKERWEKSVGRVLLKSVSEDYLMGNFEGE